MGEGKCDGHHKQGHDGRSPEYGGLWQGNPCYCCWGHSWQQWCTRGVPTGAHHKSLQGDSFDFPHKGHAEEKEEEEEEEQEDEECLREGATYGQGQASQNGAQDDQGADVAATVEALQMLPQAHQVVQLLLRHLKLNGQTLRASCFW